MPEINSSNVDYSAFGYNGALNTLQVNSIRNNKTSKTVISTFFVIIFTIIVGIKLGGNGIVIVLLAGFWVLMAYTKNAYNKNNRIYEQFALDNSFVFTKELKLPVDAGLLTEVGQFQTFTNHFSGSYKGFRFEFGEYKYFPPANNDAITVATLVVNLPKDLPNSYFDSVKNNAFNHDSFSSLIDKKQRLKLEGDFDTYFKLYVPGGYQQDVLYYLTPELMQALIVNAARYDVEIVKNKAFFYIPGGHIAKFEDFSEIFNIINTVLPEIVQNSELYKDDRALVSGSIASNGVALKKNVTNRYLIAALIVLTVAVYTAVVVLYNS